MAHRQERDSSASTSVDGEMYDLDRLRAEIEQEKDIYGMLENSVGDLKSTVIEIERRYELANEEDNEWKTRCETQEELNQLLNKQIDYLRDRLDQSRDSAKDGFESDLRSYEELSEGSLRKLLKQIEREKQSLESQLKDYEWRLDQESKAFHKANDERRNLQTELLQAKLKLEELKFPPNANSPQKKWTSQRGRGVEENVPDDQRILDPKHGPIKKTAAIKKLPKLDT
ncbi:coiled-coil domain-containing protein 169-like [Acanthaster planci]|uniref:Coiled-coil domain-containing protein 169-like n=1 Tax=Acanthaster planci TaxID=133434 RepID=A0A8B7Y1C8_ACAPL|nr:coiled-coil domain-containing protein 169-like [Acanthaster planci]